MKLLTEFFSQVYILTATSNFCHILMIKVSLAASVYADLSNWCLIIANCTHDSDALFAWMSASFCLMAKSAVQWLCMSFLNLFLATRFLSDKCMGSSSDTNLPQPYGIILYKAFFKEMWHNNAFIPWGYYVFHINYPIVKVITILESRKIICIKAWSWLEVWIEVRRTKSIRGKILDYCWWLFKHNHWMFPFSICNQFLFFLYFPYLCFDWIFFFFQKYISFFFRGHVTLKFSNLFKDWF